MSAAPPCPGRLLQVDAANAGRRLDSFVRQACQDVPLGALMRLIRCGGIRCNRRRAKGGARLAEGDVVQLPALDAGLPVAAAPAPPRLLAPIVFEDDALLVLAKPAGQVCHAGTTHAARDSLITQATGYLFGATPPPVGHRPGLAQRLDRGVSGLVAVGKDAEVLRTMGADVAAGTTYKTYTAVVTGVVRRSCGRIDAPLLVRDEPRGDRPRTVVDPAGKPAVTHFRVLQRLQQASLLAVRLETGRTHQIRAHLAHLGHAILGDPRYGAEATNAHLLQTYGLRWPLLHAGQLTVRHPRSRQLQHFAVALPAVGQRLLAALGAEPRPARQP